MDQPEAFWPNRRVLVTGCTGFLGTWVVRDLVARGAAVVGLVRDRVPDSDLIRDRLFNAIRVVRGRVEDRGRLQQLLAIHEIDTVFHLAGPTADPARFDLPLYSAARDTHPRPRVIVPVSRGDAVREAAAAGFAAASDVPLFCPKLPTVFGGGDRSRTRLVPRTARALLAGQPLPPPTGDERTDPHVYAPDAARALLRFVELVAEDPAADLPVVRCRPVVTGAAVVAALAAGVTISFEDDADAPGTVLDFATTPLSTAAADTLAWFRAAPRTLAFPDLPAADGQRRSAA